MKAIEVIKIIGKEFEATDIGEINKLLKVKGADGEKFKIHTPKAAASAFSVAIKNISSEGLKVFDIKKVTLVRFEEIKSITKAQPKEQKPMAKKTGKVAPKSAKKEKTSEEPKTEAANTSKKKAVDQPIARGSAVIPAKYRNSIR